MTSLFAHHRPRRAPNWTPLVDIIFLLLIFFMVSSSFEKKNPLPLTAAAGEGHHETIHRLQLRHDGVLIFDDKKMTDHELNDYLISSPEIAEQSVVVVVGNRVSVGRLVAVTDQLKTVDIQKLFFTAEK